MARETLILTRRDVAASLPLPDCIEAVELAHARHAEGRLHLAGVAHVPGAAGAFHVKSAGFAGAPGYVAVKVNGNFPGNPSANGLPTIQGAIVLSDGEDGFPLAILDSTEITARRTAAATAVATRHLARSGAGTVTLVGCGVQGRMHLEALQSVMKMERVFAYDVDPARASELAAVMERRTGLRVEPVASFEVGTGRSDVIVTCTTSRQAFLRPGHVPTGAFVAAVGADNPEKQEVDPELMRRSRVVVDVLEQCAEIGDLRHALDAGVMSREDVHASLGDIVRGARPGRRTPEEVFVFDSTGSAIQDVAAAGRVFEKAREGGIGLRVALA